MELPAPCRVDESWLILDVPRGGTATIRGASPRHGGIVERRSMKQNLVDPAEDIMPSSMAFALAISIIVGIAIWCGAVFLLS